MSDFKKLSLGSAMAVLLITTMMISGCGSAASNSSPTSSGGAPKGDTEAAVATGNLIGYIQVVDRKGKPLLDKSDVVVSIEAPSHLVAQSTLDTFPKATITSSGEFVIKNLQAGLYTIRIHKDGYEDYVHYNFQFNGGGDVLYNIVRSGFKLIPTLRPVPSYTFSSVELVNDPYDKNSIYVKVSVSRASPTDGAIADGTQISAIMYLGGSDVSSATNVGRLQGMTNVYGGKARFMLIRDSDGSLGSSTIRVYPFNYDSEQIYNGYELPVNSYFNPITKTTVQLGLGKPSDAILIPAQ